MKVYIITQGSYSDYHICAVTTDEKQAEKLAKLYTDRWDEAEVEEYETDDYITQLKEFDDNRLPFVVGFDERGAVVSVARDGFDYFSPKVLELSRAYRMPQDREFLRVYLYASDEDAAVKIAAEKRAEFLAQKYNL